MYKPGNWSVYNSELLLVVLK